MICRCGSSHETHPELFECVIPGRGVVVCVICGSNMTLGCSHRTCEKCESRGDEDD